MEFILHIINSCAGPWSLYSISLIPVEFAPWLTRTLLELSSKFRLNTFLVTMFDFWTWKSMITAWAQHVYSNHLATPAPKTHIVCLWWSHFSTLLVDWSLVKTLARIIRIWWLTICRRHTKWEGVSVEQLLLLEVSSATLVIVKGAQVVVKVYYLGRRLHSPPTHLSISRDFSLADHTLPTHLKPTWQRMAQSPS